MNDTEWIEICTKECERLAKASEEFCSVSYSVANSTKPTSPEEIRNELEKAIEEMHKNIRKSWVDTAHDLDNLDGYPASYTTGSLDPSSEEALQDYFDSIGITPQPPAESTHKLSCTCPKENFTFPNLIGCKCGAV